MRNKRQLDRAKWEAKMRAAGWVEQQDIFGGVYAWKHKATGRTLEGSNISTWRQLMETPPVGE